MRYLGTFIVAFVLGVGLGLAALYYNPLTRVRAPAPGGEEWLLYDSPIDNNLVLTHSGDLPLKANPADVPQLWESTIENVVLLLVELRRGDGSLFGIGTRISALSQDTDLLLHGVGLDSYWTVSAPGRGTFFVIEHENIWPVIKEAVLPAILAQGWRGSSRHILSRGPQDLGHGLVLGATGEFRGQRGRALERYELRRYSAAAGPVDMSAELGIRFVRPELGAATSGDGS